MVGDLNATRWSAPLRALLRHGGLRDTAEGGGLGGTWPEFQNFPGAQGFPLWWTGMITLDHVLASGHLTERGGGATTGGSVGPGLTAGEAITAASSGVRVFGMTIMVLVADGLISAIGCCCRLDVTVVCPLALSVVWLWRGIRTRGAGRSHVAHSVWRLWCSSGC